MTSKYYIGQLDKNSLTKQVALFNSVFNSSTSTHAWLYKHTNPLTSQYNIFGAVDDEELIGINGFMPICFQIGNEVFHAVQSCDSAIDIKYRGQGIFSKIIAAADAHYKDLGYDFMYGFPNQNSFPAFLKLGWLHLLDLLNIILPCNIASFVKLKWEISIPDFTNNIIDFHWRRIYRNSKQKSELKIIVSDKAPFTEDEYRKCNQGNKFCFYKSTQILKWKLDDNVKNDFKYYLVKRDDILLSFFIVNERLLKSGITIFSIIDWGDLSDNTNDFICSCSKILLLMKEKADLITLWCPTELCYKEIFKKIGFIRNRYLLNVNHVILKILTEDNLRNRLLRDINNWQPKIIEVDTLL